MTWAELYSEAARPTLEEIDAYAHTPLWPQLRAYLAAAYGAGPRLEYSRCGLEPGWNVKFRRGSKSLCTVYLRPGFVTAMVSVAPKDEEAAQMALLTCTAETQAVYHRSAASKMGRWLMLDITSPEMLEDVKALLAVRVKPGRVSTPPFARTARAILERNMLCLLSISTFIRNSAYWTAPAASGTCPAS